jgi:hypothetical protein
MVTINVNKLCDPVPVCVLIVADMTRSWIEWNLSSLSRNSMAWNLAAKSYGEVISFLLSSWEKSKNVKESISCWHWEKPIQILLFVFNTNRVISSPVTQVLDGLQGGRMVITEREKPQSAS